MFKKFAVVAVVLVAVLMVAGLAMAQDEMKKTEAAAVTAATTMAETTVAPVVVGNKVCPVTGNAIAEADMGKNTVVYEGKVYNLCCAACPVEFNKDPKMYVAKVEAAMAKAVAPVQAQ